MTPPNPENAEATAYRALAQNLTVPADGLALQLAVSPCGGAAETFLTARSDNGDILLYLGIDWERRQLVLSRCVANEWSAETRLPLPDGRETVNLELRLGPGGFEVAPEGGQTHSWPSTAAPDSLFVSGRWQAAGGAAPGPDQYFCLFHEGRCGSTVLASLLNQHPRIRHFNEILTRGSWISHEFEHSPWKERRENLGIREADLADFIRSLPGDPQAAPIPAGPRVIGFEIKFYQLMQLGGDLASVTRELTERLGDVRFAFLTRRNILRRHVSALRCLRNDVTHAKDLAAVNFDKVRVDIAPAQDLAYDYTRKWPDLPAMLEATEARRQEAIAFARGNGHLGIEYEEFERDPMIGARRILDFLGLPAVEAGSHLLRTGDKPLADLVENYPEVRSTLEPTRWSDMLD